LPGFGVKITPKGHRVFVAQYTPRSQRGTGRRRRLTIGPFGPLTVEQARDAARTVLGRVARGEDPAADAKRSDVEARAARENTVDAVSAVYLDELEAKVRPSTLVEYRRLRKRDILPTLGTRPVSLVTTQEVARLHAAGRKRPYAANRILQLLAGFFGWAETRGYRARGTNPCRDVARFPEHPRERFLTVEEVGRLGTALRTAETVGVPPAPQHRREPKTAATAKHRPKTADTPKPASPYAVAAIRFLLLTGWREQEALTLRWDAIDDVRGVATLKMTKTGKSHRPVGGPALELLAALPRLEGSPYVFPGAKPGQPLREIKRTWAAVRFAADLADVRLHDLRHTVASFSVASGHSLYLTGKLLGHTRSETTQRYAHLSDDARKAAADSVSGALAAALSADPADVVPINRKRQAR
jgi:integrase